MQYKNTLLALEQKVRVVSNPFSHIKNTGNAHAGDLNNNTPVLVTTLQKEWKEFTLNRETSLKTMRKNITGFKNTLQTIRDKLKDIRQQSRAASEAESLQLVLETFEAKLSTYKSAMRLEYDGLEAEENVLEQDLNASLLRFEHWEAGEDNGVNDADNAKKVLSSQLQQQTRARTDDRYEKQLSVQADIGAIDRQLAVLGGRCGKWDSRDHDVFIRIWTQTISTPIHDPEDREGIESEYNAESIIILSAHQRSLFMKKIIPVLPGKNEDEVHVHIEWYFKIFNNNLSHLLIFFLLFHLIFIL